MGKENVPSSRSSANPLLAEYWMPPDQMESRSGRRTDLTTPKVHEIVSNLIEHSQKVGQWYIVAVEAGGVGIIRPTNREMDVRHGARHHKSDTDPQ
jgi:hypothetical protein